MERVPIYVDNAATTALSDKAFAEMLPYFQQNYGNASSIHSLGQESKNAVENSRKRVAKSINALQNEIFFTSGGSESDNWALYGSLMMKTARKGRHLIVSSIEHSAVHRTAQFLETRGYEVTYLPVDEYGKVTPSSLAEAIRADTVLISVMMANNEIGTIQPIRELCELAHQRHIPFHTDAVQAVGHIPVNVRELGVDMLSMSAHKFYGPKGVGALYVKLGRILPPVIIGGGQEKNWRSGTENVPGIVGMAAALEDAVNNMEENTCRVCAMRDRLIASVLQMNGALLTGHPVDRLPGIASFVFRGLTNPAIVAELNKVGICASSGSACSSGSTELTRAIQQLPGETVGYNSAGQVALRLSPGTCNTDEEIDYVIDQLPKVVRYLKTSRLFTTNIASPQTVKNPDEE